MAKDRTAEFHNTLLSIKSRSVTPQNGSAGTRRDNEAKQSLLGNGVASGSKPKGKGKDEGGSKSEFGRLAAGIAKDINATTLKLQKLAQLAKRKTLFDDRPIEISELTYIIRQDIASLNTQIGSLQSYVRAQKEGKNGTKGGAAQVDEHNTNVVMLLQSRLANMGMGFKDVLELRTQNMKASKDRTEQFMHTTANSSVPPPSNSTSPPAKLYREMEQELTPDSLLFSQPPAAGGPGTGFPSDRKGKARALPDDPDSKDFLALDLDGDRGENGQGQGGGYQQMQLVEQQNDYIQSRSTAIESIESTIAELGSIFSQLANMVAEQRETVQRIDADTTDIAANVSGAQRELLKYYASVTSNRWLMLKIFGVLIIFFLVFILVS